VIALAKYLVRRILQIIPVLLIISIIVFILVNVAGDPTSTMLPPTASDEERDILREALGLNKPLPEQYWIFITNAVKGDFGTSFRYKLPAADLAIARIPASVQLAGVALLFSIIIAIPLGILSAQYRNSPFDLLISGVSVLGRAMPGFWVAIMLILLLAVQHQVFPVSGRDDGLMSLILPGLTLSFGCASQIIPLIRSNMLDIMHQDYIRTARSKGIKESLVICKHAFKNALVPVVTIVALQIPGLIGGALITETVFAWPGLGQLLVQSINARDMSIVQACIFIIALLTLVANLIADIVYCLVDPRIKY
jgi:peptide/nickel transport system permease protein